MMSDIVAPPNGSVVGALNLGAHLIRLPGMARPERCTVLVGDGAHGKPVVGIRRGTDWRVQWLDLNTKLGEVTGLQMCDQVTAGAGCPAHAAGTWRALRAKLTGANVVDCTKPVTP